MHVAQTSHISIDPCRRTLRRFDCSSYSLMTHILPVPREHSCHDLIQQGDIQVLGEVENGLQRKRAVASSVKRNDNGMRVIPRDLLSRTHLHAGSSSLL